MRRKEERTEGAAALGALYGENELPNESRRSRLEADAAAPGAVRNDVRAASITPRPVPDPLGLPTERGAWVDRRPGQALVQHGSLGVDVFTRRLGRASARAGGFAVRSCPAIAVVGWRTGSSGG